MLFFPFQILLYIIYIITSYVSLSSKLVTLRYFVVLLKKDLKLAIILDSGLWQYVSY